LNQALEKANRTADFLEFAELMVDDALSREESCGCHFNIAFQTKEQEALRRDDTCSYVSAWEYQGEGKAAAFHREPLQFEYVELAARSYK
jgi:succinate dehydrogenase / fumarate reductase, flavoprotein subunit